VELTLATKRTSAERLITGSYDTLVFEPYANPFRMYPLVDDYNCFKKLISNNVSCYILNTANFMGKDIPKELTLSLLEQIVDDKANFTPWPEMPEFSFIPVDGYQPDMSDVEYRKAFKANLQERYTFIENCHRDKDSINIS
jgi:phosphoenolpyruvate carboxykinase (ATP)